MSERSRRKVQAAELEAALREAELAGQRNSRMQDALKVALEIVGEEPRKLLPTKVTFHPLPVQMMGQEGDCSECGVTLSVHPVKFWHFCPNCGSKVANVLHESVMDADLRQVRSIISAGLAKG